MGPAAPSFSYLQMALLRLPTTEQAWLPGPLALTTAFGFEDPAW